MLTNVRRINDTIGGQAFRRQRRPIEPKIHMPNLEGGRLAVGKLEALLFLVELTTKLAEDSMCT